ncbi:MAG TPA: four helix bundle protein [Vitreimonas sp.]|nr:four helix bundle protein [Vitreimonas sp.]
MINHFTNLRIWKSSHSLALEIYYLCDKLPIKEKFTLESQLKRAVNSVSANIAESFGRKHTKDRIRFLYTSRGSAYEVQNHLLLIHSLKYCNDGEVKDLILKYQGLTKGINTLIKSLLNQNLECKDI